MMATAAAPTYATTGNIPYGRADLLLGIDILEAARAIDPREQFRVASPGKTCAVLNTFKQPTVYGLLGRQDFDPDALREEIFAHCRHDQSFARNLSDLCEQRLGSKLYANLMMLGVAFQLGLILVSAWSIAWAIKDSIKAATTARTSSVQHRPQAGPGAPRPAAEARARDVGAARQEQGAASSARRACSAEPGR